MDLFSRYIMRQTVTALLMILGSLTAIVWIATSVKQFDQLSSGSGFFLFLKMTTLAMPQAMAIVTPFALLIASLYALHKLNADSELIVMTASGAPVWRFIGPFISLALVVSIVILMSNLFVQPASMQKLRGFIIKVRSDLISHVLQSGKFSSPTNKITFHIRDRAKNGDLLGLLVHDQRDPKQNLTYLAEVGELIKSGGRAYLKMTNGHIHRSIVDKDGVQIVKFDEYIFDLSEFGAAKKGIQKYKPRARYLSGLINPPVEDLKQKKLMGLLRAELHDRFSSSLYPLLFVFISLATFGLARTTREARGKLLVLAFSIGLGTRLAGLGAINLLKVNPGAVWLVYGIPIGGIILCILYIWRYMSPEYFEPFLSRLDIRRLKRN